MEKKFKRIKDSYTEQVQILSLGNLNGYNRLHGGQLMQWIDIVAAVVARRHSEKNVTTGFVDMLKFQKPARANDVLVLTGYLCYVGRTSMEVCVETFVEKQNGERERINEAFVVMVALDENEKPTEVPGLILENEVEKMRWKQAEERRERRKLYR